VKLRNKIIFYGEEMPDTRPTLKLEDQPCRLSAIAYSIYLQLPSISGGHPSIVNLRTGYAMVTRDPLNMDL
jgi:hypothetical protein